MIKNITNFLYIFFIFQQLKSKISKIYQNGYKPFCDETLQLDKWVSFFLIHSSTFLLAVIFSWFCTPEFPKLDIDIVTAVCNFLSDL